MGIQNICAICSRQISDMYFLIVGSKLTVHLECLKCSICLQKLEMQSKCFVKNGKFYCLEHYPVCQESEICCSSCKARVMSNDYVIRSNLDRIYHFNCFKCAKCLRQIEPGTKYGISNDMVYCYQHYLSPDEFWQNPTIDMNNNSSDSYRFDQSFSSSSVDSSPLSFNPQLKSLENRTSLSMSSKTISTNGSTRKKRLRTSFKHQQLRIMKAHFQINQNPDSKDLKELSERTGLQKRVLQVWFQNSRAKQRKSTNGPYTGMGGILSKSAIDAQNSFNNKPISMNHEDTYVDVDDNDDQESNDDENLEYEIDDDLNESNSKDDNSNEQNQYYNQQQQQQQPIIDFYHCF